MRNNLQARKTKLDINQKVYIENSPVVGDGAGEGAVENCQPLAPQFVTNPAAPKVKVCGTQLKVTMYLRGRCEEYYKYQWPVGACDTGLPPSTCKEMSPADDPKLGAVQSYKVEFCA